jgi:hypothetical protein
MLLLLLFSIKVLHSYQIGFISILTLACSNGYVSNHGARSGDLDASLVFWTTLYVLACIKFLTERKKRKVFQALHMPPELTILMMRLLIIFLMN